MLKFPVLDFSYIMCTSQGFHNIHDNNCIILIIKGNSNKSAK